MKRPRIRNVARYGFYLYCALGVAALSGGLLALAGIDPDMGRHMGSLIGVVGFFALRDLDVNAEVRAVERTLPHLHFPPAAS